MAYRNVLSQLSAASWFSFPKPNPMAKLRLFCLPYAGSGANIFYKWPSSLPDSVDLCLVHLPGREHRLKEKPYERMASLVQALGRVMLPYLDRPVAFFGHSMGGMVSFELARQLRREYGLEPARLFISGCCGPQSAHLLPRIHTLPTQEFLSELRRLNGVSGPMSSNPNFLKLMLLTLRADIKVCETYSYASEPPLDCPITVYGGLQDYALKYEYLEAWRKETIGSFAMHLFSGDHFFVHTAEKLILNVLMDELHNLANNVDEADPVKPDTFQQALKTRV